jgi:ABC-type Co2+ transport system permease subunit
MSLVKVPLAIASGVSSVASRVKRRVHELRERPLMAVLVISFFLAWALRIPAQNQSRLDSFLAGTAWILLMGWLVVALVGSPRGNKSVGE